MHKAFDLVSFKIVLANLMGCSSMMVLVVYLRGNQWGLTGLVTFTPN